MKERNRLTLRSKRLLKQLLGKDIWTSAQVKIPVEFHGKVDDGWCVASGILSQNSIVYSIGVGQDVLFDLSLIDHYGLTIYAYDPTPESIEWIKKQDLPGRFLFFEKGLAHYDGSAHFFLSKKKCYTMKKKAEKSDTTFEVPVNRLETLCKENNHSHIDLLKIDIEGTEYEVIEDIMASSITIDQILVEFHHRFKDISNRETKKAIARMNQLGYHIFFVSLKGREYSFINERLLKHDSHR